MVVNDGGWGLWRLWLGVGCLQCLMVEIEFYILLSKVGIMGNILIE